MSQSKVKVLQVNASSKVYGGVSAMIFNLYKHIDREKIVFDFFCPEYSTYGLVENEIKKMGGRIFEYRISGNKIIKKFKLARALRSLIKENKYDVIHINSGSFFFNLEVSIISKLLKVKKIIIHSHNAGGNKGLKVIVMKMLKPLLTWAATDLLSCSQKAAYYMFSKRIVKLGKYKVIKNGIETSKYVHNSKTREMMRRKLKIDDEAFLIGHVGRFNFQKNHKFLIQIFSELIKSRPNSKLLLIGAGELEESIKELCESLNLLEKVIFYGMSDNVNELMQAMDVFVLPSLFEGLPVVGIEAQAAGLKCYLSQNITEETNITGNITFLEIDDTEKWVQKLLDFDCSYNHENTIHQITENGYDIHSSAKELENIYLDF